MSAELVAPPVSGLATDVARPPELRLLPGTCGHGRGEPGRALKHASPLVAVAALLAAGGRIDVAADRTASYPGIPRTISIPMLRYLGDALGAWRMAALEPVSTSAGIPPSPIPQSLLFTPTMLLFGWLVPAPSMELFDLVVFAHLLPGALAILAIFRRRGWRPEGGDRRRDDVRPGRVGIRTPPAYRDHLRLRAVPAGLPGSWRISLDRRSYRFGAPVRLGGQHDGGRARPGRIPVRHVADRARRLAGVGERPASRPTCASASEPLVRDGGRRGRPLGGARSS